MKSVIALGLLACSGLAQAAEVVVFNGHFVSVNKETMSITNKDAEYDFVLKIDFFKCQTVWEDMPPVKGVCKGNTMTQSTTNTKYGVVYLSTNVITKDEKGVYQWLSSSYNGKHMEVSQYTSKTVYKVR